MADAVRIILPLGPAALRQQRVFTRAVVGAVSTHLNVTQSAMPAGRPFRRRNSACRSTRKVELAQVPVAFEKRWSVRANTKAVPMLFRAVPASHETAIVLWQAIGRVAVAVVPAKVRRRMTEVPESGVAGSGGC